MKALELFKLRRTQYALSKELPLPRKELEELILTVIRECPSAFNSQSSRAVILFGEQHSLLWDEIVKETLRPLTAPEKFGQTEQKLASFSAGTGTILFFEDQAVVRDLQAKFPTYANYFPDFSANSAGMAQFAVWTALAEAGIGASLQHYHPVINAQVRATWNIPEEWSFSAQMPFGGNAAAIQPKSYISDSGRFRVVG